MALQSLHDLPASNTVNQVLAECSAADAGLPLAVLPIPGDCVLENNFHDTPRIFVAQQGQGMRWMRRGRVSRTMHTAPRMIEMYEAGLAFDREVWQGQPGRCVRIEFAASHVQTLTHGELQSLDLQTHHELFDDRVSKLTLELAQEALFGMPEGDLYLQGLCVSLLGLLSSRYTSGAGLERDSDRTFTLTQRRRLDELIRVELGSKLSLSRMAGEAGVSQFHFARLFKATYGSTPHRYVQDLRLDMASEALKKRPDASIAGIALACGFASQSHLTETMRRRLGVTPHKLRHERRA